MNSFSSRQRCDVVLIELRRKRATGVRDARRSSTVKLYCVASCDGGVGGRSATNLKTSKRGLALPWRAPPEKNGTRLDYVPLDRRSQVGVRDGRCPEHLSQRTPVRQSDAMH